MQVNTTTQSMLKEHVTQQMDNGNYSVDAYAKKMQVSWPTMQKLLDSKQLLSQRMFDQIAGYSGFNSKRYEFKNSLTIEKKQEAIKPIESNEKNGTLRNGDYITFDLSTLDSLPEMIKSVANQKEKLISEITQKEAELEKLYVLKEKLDGVLKIMK